MSEDAAPLSAVSLSVVPLSVVPLSTIPSSSVPSSSVPLPATSGEPLHARSGDEADLVPLSVLLPPTPGRRPSEASATEVAEKERTSAVPPSSGWQLKAEYALYGRKPSKTSEEQVLTIRVLEDITEMMDAYRLRYDVYEALNHVQQKNVSRLEIDEFDAYAIPFGAFSARTGELLGTLRLITDRQQTPYIYKIQRILHESADEGLTEAASKPRVQPMPSISSSRVETMLARFNKERRGVQELSRMIVHPERRGLGVSRGLMEFGLAYARQHDGPMLIGACIPQHVPMYGRYGYIQLPGTVISVSDIVGRLANTIVCDTRQLPEPTSARVAEVHRALREGAKECTLDLSEDPLGIYRFSEGGAPEGGLAALNA